MLKACLIIVHLGDDLHLQPLQASLWPVSCHMEDATVSAKIPFPQMLIFYLVKGLWISTSVKQQISSDAWLLSSVARER